MKPAQVKILVVSVAIAGGIVLLAVEGSRSATVYFQTLPEFKAQGGSGTRPVRLTGYVTDGSIQRRASEPLLFVMEDKDRTASQRVAYRDIVPDTFKDGAEVVVEGRLGADGTFEATTLLAKCPSKYESAEVEERRQQASRPAPAGL